MEKIRKIVVGTASVALGSLIIFDATRQASANEIDHEATNKNNEILNQSDEKKAFDAQVDRASKDSNIVVNKDPEQNKGTLEEAKKDYKNQADELKSKIDEIQNTNAEIERENKNKKDKFDQDVKNWNDQNNA